MAVDRVYTLTREAMRQVQRAVRRSERNNPAAKRDYRPISQTCCYIAKAPAGGIAARSGTTPGSATVDLYKINGAGELVVVEDDANNTVTLTAYNVWSSAVPASVYIQLVQDVFGRYIVMQGECE